jgi:hypothetical protein
MPSGVAFRIVLFHWSAMNILPLVSTTTPHGLENCAVVPKPLLLPDDVAEIACHEGMPSPFDIVIFMSYSNAFGVQNLDN